MTTALTIISAVNRDDVLSANLLRSPDVISGVARVIAERGHMSAEAAYNAGLERAGAAEVVALIHQDVYLPAGWVVRLNDAVQQLSASDPGWGVLGVVGLDAGQNTIGEVWDNGMRRRVGSRVEELQKAVTIDELVIVLRGGLGIYLDPELPGFHLYAADLVQTARARRMNTYVFDGPVVHNSLLVGQLDKSYRAAYRYMQRKWRNSLPVPTCVMPVTRWGWPLTRRSLRIAKRELFYGASSPDRHPSPATLAWELGYEFERETVVQ